MQEHSELHQRPTRLEWVKAISVALIALLAAAVPAKPARAALSDCAEALYDTVDLAQYLTQQAGAIAGCSDKLSFSPPATAAVGALVALVYIAGEFNDEATCKKLVNSTISKMLAQMLASAPKVKGALETVLSQVPCAGADASGVGTQCAADGYVDGKATLAAFIDKAGTDAAAQLASIPGLDRIFGLMNCSCTIMGTGIETIERVKEIASDVGSCAGTFSSAVFSGVEWLHCHMGHCTEYTGICGVPQYQCGGQVPISCDPGASAKGCYAIQQVKWDSCDKDVAQYCGTQLICNGSANIRGKTSATGMYNGTLDSRCFCPPGEGFDMTKPGQPCAACTGDGRVVTADGSCGAWTCAATKPGMKLVSYGDSVGECNYEHTCQGGMVWDSKKNACGTCADNYVFSGYGQGGVGNSGSCRECAYDEALKYEKGIGGGWKVSAQGSTSLEQLTCQKLTCEGLSHADPKRPHQCAPCKEIFNAGGVKLGGDLSKQYGDRPVCLDLVIESLDKCPRGEMHYPDGKCHKIPAALDPSRTKVSSPSGPINSGIKQRQDKGYPSDSVAAPSLDGIGTGAYNPGSSAPGSSKSSPTGQTMAPSGNSPGTYNQPGGYAAPGAYTPPGGFSPGQNIKR